MELRQVVEFTTKAADKFGSSGFSEVLSDGKEHYISHEMTEGGKLHFKWVDGDDFVTMRFGGKDYKIELS